MINKAFLSFRERADNPFVVKILGTLLDILIVALPILVIGFISTKLVTDTMLGGMLINLAYVLSVVAAWGVLKMRGLGWPAMGLARPKSWLRTLLMGIGTLVAAIFVINAAQWLVLSLPGLMIEPPDISRFNVLEGNLPLLLLLVTAAWTTIAFGEEIIFRAFLIDRLSELFNRTRLASVLAVIGNGIAFGLVHAQEGPAGIITNGAFGLLFGVIYLRTKRNLWVTIIAHGLLNTLRFVLVYMGAV